MALSDTWLKANNGKARTALEERGDREGLGVRITPKGKITFQLRYRYSGTPKRLDLGSYPLMSLKEARGEALRLPSLANIARIEKAAGHERDPALVSVLRPGDTCETFEQAATRSPTQVPDLLSAFARATQQRLRDRETGDDKAPALDRMTRPSRDGDQVAERSREPDRGGD